jgi:ribosome-associated translation inhibitor RaiA
MTDIENAKLEAAPQRLKERTADARTELKSMADFIGQDLSKMPLDDILTKLGLDPSDFATTDQKLAALEGSLEKLGSADPAEITPEVDLVGVNDRLEKVKEYLSGTEKKKPDVTPQVDQSAVETAVKKAKETIDSELKSPVDVNLNAEKAIGKIREDLKEQIDLAIGSSEGTKHLSSIDNLVSKIESLVSKISEKLPMQALSY